ncbi:protein RER1-like [Antedon mediterranea]|uniref:protein RER1-like n=1 Tax=Antedon mediterranea TaxID=105859 RepID=UPI003AF6ED17
MESVPTMEMPSKPGVVSRFFTTISQKYQSFLDRWVPYPTVRWVFTLVIFLLYFLRVFLLQGWYIVTYALGIYLLNLFIAFLSPKIDPVFEQEDEDGPSLPTKSSEEFRPFIRRLPEFKFWYSATKAVIIAMFCTFFEVFNVPVFWPILVMYFFILFFLTMKRQIRHMIKYKYLPFSHGKTKYKGKEDSGEVIAQ